MIDTKHVNVDINWLDEIDGLTVEQAIEYLHTLQKEHILCYSMEGDTHGCSVESYMYYLVPLTNAEKLANAEVIYNRRISVYVESRKNHIKYNKPDRVSNCDRLIKQLEKILDDARVEYGMNANTIP